MTRPVLYELDQFGAIGSSCSRAFRESFTNLAVAGEDLVDVRADRLHDVDIFSLGISTEIISLADASLLQHPLDAAAMIANVQPISHLQSVAVNRNRLSIERVDDSERNQLLGKVIRTVVIGRVGRGDRKSIRVVVSAYQMVGRGFTGSVGRVRGIGCVFGERRRRRSKRAVDFVRRKGMESPGTAHPSSVPA